MQKSFTHDKMNTITKDDFQAVEKVRSSGKTNMYDFKKVVELSKVPLEKLHVIFQNYSELGSKFKG